MSATSDFLLADDVELVMDATTSPPQAGPSPIAPGNYGLKLTSLKRRLNVDGKPVTRTSKLVPGYNFPVYVIERVRVVEPVENERDLVLYQDLSTSPYLRDGAPAGQLIDILRSYDKDAEFRTLQEGLDQLEAFVSEGRSFNAYVDWQGYDAEFAKAAIAEATALASGGLSDIDKNNIYAKAKVKGYKKFPKHANGGYSHIWLGPTGNVVEGRAAISRYINAGDEKVKLGPVKDFLK